MKNTIKAAIAALIIISMIALAIPATAAAFQSAAPAMDPSHPYTGSVSGRVTTSNTTKGIPYADVYIVNATNVDEVFYHTKSDANGYYQITGVNNTWGGDGTLALYKAFANSSDYGDGLSESFGVEQNSTSWAAVIILPKPAKIVLSGKNNVLSNGMDHTLLSAYVTDKRGEKVVDGYSIRFYDDNTTTGMGIFGPKGSNSPTAGDVIIATTFDGFAKAEYGWATYEGMYADVTAEFVEDVLINDTMRVYFSPVTCAWFGSVVDSQNNGYGNIKVTLHFMAQNYTENSGAGSIWEVYNMTRVTSNSLPYVGTFTFDDIVIPRDNATIDAMYAFVSAEHQLTPSLKIEGSSRNETMQAGRTADGFIVLHVPQPTGIEVTADPETILVGGDISNITAQLFLNGEKYEWAGVDINFDSDNDTVGYLLGITTIKSNEKGIAIIPLKSNMTIGDVNITAWVNTTAFSSISDSCVVHVVNWGTISGIVTDANRNGIPGAKVTLYYRVYNTTTGKWINGKEVPLPENPQNANDGKTAAKGMYTYERVPAGLYNVTGESEGHVYFAWIDLQQGTFTANIAIPDYTYTEPVVVTPTPTVVVTPTPTATPTPTPTPTPKPTPGFETVFALAGLLGVAYLIARKEN